MRALLNSDNEQRVVSAPSFGADGMKLEGADASDAATLIYRKVEASRACATRKIDNVNWWRQPVRMVRHLEQLRGCRSRYVANPSDLPSHDDRPFAPFAAPRRSSPETRNPALESGA